MLAVLILLSLYAVGRTTGLVVDIGHGVTVISPFVEGYAIRSAVKRCNIGGHDITTYLMKLLLLRNNNRTLANLEAASTYKEVEQIKEVYP
jgi:actin-related protein